MREIKAEAVAEAVAALCIQANAHLPADVAAALAAARAAEPWPLAQHTLGLLEKNLEMAHACALPICQDTGMDVVFASYTSRHCRAVMAAVVGTPWAARISS